MCQSVEELLVYDFDGTLADTPTPITGKEMYKRKTGREWPITDGGVEKRAWNRLWRCTLDLHFRAI